MFVQHCVKGVHGINAQTAKAILAGDGILCNWVRLTLASQFINSSHPSNHPIHYYHWEARRRLTDAALDNHIHHYATVQSDTPFISLSAGCVSRDAFLRANTVRRARDTAVEFATDGGMGGGWLFYLWVMVGLNPAAEVEGIAEEVRELSTYRRYSPYQTEGEITAKLIVPANQIRGCEQIDKYGNRTGEGWLKNLDYSPPERLTNQRPLI